MSVLLIDIGNSRIKWRCADTVHGWGNPSPAAALAHAERAALRDAWKNLHAEAVYVANVAGAVALRDVRAALAETSPAEGPAAVPVEVLVPQTRQCGVTNGYRDPTQLGADRWAALLGARALHPERAVLVISLGTATTIDLLQADGHFPGGVILPGLALMRAALARNTAQLPLAQGRYVALADNTDDAIDSGILHAQAGAIERVHRTVRATLVPSGTDLQCLLTGGHAAAVAPLLPFHAAIEDNLVLRGLFEIARCAPARS